MLKQTLFVSLLTISLSSFCAGDNTVEWVEVDITPADTPSTTYETTYEAPSVDNNFDSYASSISSYGDSVVSAADTFTSGPSTFEK